MGAPARIFHPTVTIRYAFAAQDRMRTQGKIHVLAGAGGIRFGQRLRKGEGEPLCRSRFSLLVPDRTGADFRAHPCVRCELLVGRMLDAGVQVEEERLLPRPWLWVREGVHAEDGHGWVLSREGLHWLGAWRLHRSCAGVRAPCTGRFSDLSACPSGRILGTVLTGTLPELLSNAVRPEPSQRPLFDGYTSLERRPRA